MIKAAKINFEKALGETPKAVLININGTEHWIPKSLCESFRTNNQLKGSVILPAFIINKIFEIDINKVDELPEAITPTWIIEHHEPTKIEPLENNTIKELKR